MLGVPRRLIEHSLSVDPKATPNDNIFIVLPMKNGTPSRRNSPNYSWPASSEKSSILSGLPTPSSFDSTAGCDLLCFLDCYSGYHQIAIKEEDQEKTAFIPRLAPTATQQCHSG
jgi:hypothetical protein